MMPRSGVERRLQYRLRGHPGAKAALPCKSCRRER